MLVRPGFLAADSSPPALSPHGRDRDTGRDRVRGRDGETGSKHSPASSKDSYPVMRALPPCPHLNLITS